MRAQSILRLLSRDEMERIHSFALRILSEIGVQIRHEKALRILKDGGCEVNGYTVKMPEELIAEIENKITKSPTRLYYRHNDEDKYIDFSEGPFLGLRPLELRRLEVGNTGALYVLDPGRMERREATLEDVRKIAYISNFLENIKVLSIPVQPQDCPLETRGFHALVEVMRYSNKPIVFGGVDPNLPHSMRSVEYIVKVAEIMSGSNEEMRKKPHISVLLEVISPLRYEEHEIDFVLRCIELGVNAVNVASMPIMGLTAPLSIPAAIAQSLAEIIPGIYLFYLVDPDVRISPGLDVIPCEMQTLNHVFAAPETTIIGLAETEFAREYYKVPVWGSRSFRSDAKIPGIQAAFEKGVTATLALLAGASGFGNAGVIDGDSMFSYEQLIIDNEFISLLGQIVKGVESHDEDFSIERFKRCISKPTYFLTDDLTLTRIRKTIYPPKLFERRSYESWLKNGKKTVREKAEDEVRKILKEYERATPLIDRDEIRQIEEIIKEAERNLSY